MATVTVQTQLEDLVDALGALRVATPVGDPNYENIKRQYQEASDRLTQALGKSIDDADADYRGFSEGIQGAITTIEDATSDIGKVAEAVNIAAQVLDVVGKVVGKLV